MDRCDACQFVYEDLALDDVPATLRAYPTRSTTVRSEAVAMVSIPGTIRA